jgi:hypothetical protein
LKLTPQSIRILTGCAISLPTGALRRATDPGIGNSKMLLFLRMGVLLLAMLVNTAFAATPPKTNFGFCPVPWPPGCVDDAKAYGGGSATNDCQEKLSRYVASVFVYRMCLLHETQRAVLETNMMIDRFKCGLKAKHRCSDEDMRPKK